MLAKSAAIPARIVHRAPGMAERKRVLVINDTKEILELFRDVLEREMGHDVTS